MAPTQSNTSQRNPNIQPAQPGSVNGQKKQKTCPQLNKHPFQKLKDALVMQEAHKAIV